MVRTIIYVSLLIQPVFCRDRVKGVRFVEFVHFPGKLLK